MSLAQNTFLDIQNILCCIFLHLGGEEHSEYYYNDITVFWEINLFQQQSIQNTMKVSSYENTENNTLNIQHSILRFNMLRIVRLFLQYPFSIFWQNILSPILCLQLIDMRLVTSVALNFIMIPLPEIVILSMITPQWYHVRPILSLMIQYYILGSGFPSQARHPSDIGGTGLGCDGP
jgi:hypothetical protein